MPQLALTAVAGLVTGAYTAAGVAALTVSFPGLALATTVFANLASTVALSALSSALTGSPDTGARNPGQLVEVQASENVPQTRILGRYMATRVQVYDNSDSHGDKKPNLYYQQVLALSSAPAGLAAISVNGEWRKFYPTVPDDEAKFGRPVAGFRDKKRRNLLWIKYYDGTQTSADQMLVDTYGNDSIRPYGADRIGQGTPYAIVTSRYDREFLHRIPDVQFELSGAKYYDPRKDSSIGGNGPQRWDDPATHEPSRNPIVQIVNVRLGLRHPITGEHVWGGKDYTPHDFDASSMFAAMNACYEQVEKKDGSFEARFQSDLEISFDQAPFQVEAELRKACAARIADMGGLLYFHVGAPSAPVYNFSDDHVVITEREQLDPFPAAGQIFNGVSSQYPNRENGYRPKASPKRLNAAFLAEDDNIQNVASTSYPAVTAGSQVQRLDKYTLQDSRRLFRHSIVLPPEAEFITAVDTVSYSSVRNGYDSKSFFVDLIEPLPGGARMLSLREVDADDDAFHGPTDELDETTTKPGSHVPAAILPDFSVTGFINENSHPAIKLSWFPETDSDGVNYTVRNATTKVVIPSKLTIDNRRDLSDPVLLEIEPGVPLEVAPGENLVREYPGDVSRGFAVITDGLASNKDYEVKAHHLDGDRPIKQSPWLPVTTPVVLINETQLEVALRDRIQAGEDGANAANAAATAAAALSAITAAKVDTLAGDTIEDLEALTAQLQGLSVGDIAEIREIALAGIQDGWGSDPAFHNWTGNDLTDWITLGIAPHGTQAAGPKGSGVRVTVAPGNGDAITLRIEPDSADLTAEYVVVSVIADIEMCNIADLRLRPEWEISAAWTRGDGFGEVGTDGSGTDWGLVEEPGRLQSKSVVFRKPDGAATKLALECALKQSSDQTEVNLTLGYLDIRAATEAEIKAYGANGYADAKISDLEATIIGPEGAIATATQQMQAEFGAADATLSQALTTVSDGVSALAGRITRNEASLGDPGNIIRTPDFEDGTRGDWSSGTIGTEVPPDTEFTRSLVISNWCNQNPMRPGNVAGRTFGFTGWAYNPSNWDFRASIRTRGADGTPYYVSKVAAPAQTGWARFDVEVTVGSRDVIEYNPRFTFSSGGSGDKEFHVVDLRCEDRTSTVVAHGLIEQITLADVDEDGVVASMQSQVIAEFGSFSSFVHQAATAVATDDLLANTWVLRQISGAAAGFVEAVTYDNPDGPAASNFTIGYDMVDIPGLLRTSKLLVADSSNIVPGFNMAEESLWELHESIEFLDEAASLPGTIGSLRFVDIEDDADPGIFLAAKSIRFPVEPEEDYYVGYGLYPSLQLRGDRYRTKARLTFFDEDGNDLNDDISFGYVTDDASGLRNETASIRTPTGARKADFRYYIWGGPDTERRLELGAPIMRKKTPGALLITPDSITGAEMVKAQAIITNTAQMGELTVGTINILH